MSNGLTNDDFRKIMATPRRVDIEETPRRSTQFAKPAAVKPPTSSRSRPVKSTSQPESLLPAGYRDRAQERREREQSGLLEAPIENEQITAEDIEALPDHLSKYLGGDENRTHLVKGLDYLLLQKSRDDIQKDEERKLEKAMADAAAAAAAAANVAKDEQSSTSESVSFKSTMARNIYNKCIEQAGHRVHRNHQCTTFQPGRTVYEFEIDTFGSATLPTILHRSEEDCGPVVNPISAKLPADTWARLEDAMKCIRSGVKPRNIDPVPIHDIDDGTALPSVKQQSIVTFNDDDDIFDDVGDYVCEPRQPDSTPTTSLHRVTFTPEQDLDETVDEPAKISMRDAIMQARSTAGQLGVFEKNIEEGDESEPVDHDQKSESTPDQNNKSAKLLSMMDDYDEYTAGAQMGYDSDDEIRTNEKKPGALSATKISKAKSREKQKLNTQWQQISSMIDQKKNKKESGGKRHDDHTDDGHHGVNKRSRPNP